MEYSEQVFRLLGSVFQICIALKEKADWANAVLQVGTLQLPLMVALVVLAITNTILCTVHH